MKHSKKTDTTPARTRRTVDEMIADHEAEIARIKARAAAKEAKADPAIAEALKLARVAARSLDRAQDPDLVVTLNEVCDPLRVFLGKRGIAMPKTRERRPKKASSAA